MSCDLNASRHQDSMHVELACRPVWKLRASALPSGNHESQCMHYNIKHSPLLMLGTLLDALWTHSKQSLRCCLPWRSISEGRIQQSLQLMFVKAAKSEGASTLKALSAILDTGTEDMQKYQCKRDLTHLDLARSSTWGSAQELAPVLPASFCP